MQEMGDLLYSGGDAAVIEMFDSMKTKNAGGFLDYTCIRQQLPPPALHPCTPHLFCWKV